MRKLFKNSFFSFLKSKVGMIIISAIIFLTSATFTLLNSTANSFDQSYANVTSAGALHDFTVKEKYATQGDVHIEASASAPKTVVQIQDVNNVADAQYIYVRPNQSGKTNALTGKITLKNSAGSTTIDTIFRFPKEQLELVDTDKDGTIDAIDLSKGIDISFYQESYSYAGTPPSSRYAAIAANRWSTPIHIDDKTTTLSGIKHSTRVTSLVRKLIIAPNLGTSLVTYLKANKALTTNEVVNITIPKPTQTTGDYKNYIDALASAEWDQLVASVAKKTSFVVSKTNYDATGTTPNPSIVPEVSKAIDALKLNLQSLIANNLSSTFAKKVDQLYGANGSEGYKLNMTPVRSTNISVGDHKFKVVNGSKDDAVDKLVLFSGWKPSVPKTHEQMKDGLDASLKSSKHGNEFLTLIDNKGYRFDYTWDKSVMGISVIPYTVHYIDPTAFEAVVTPEYARINNIKPIDPAIVEKLAEEATEVTRKDHAVTEIEYISQKIKENYQDNVIWIDAIPYFITGTGITPDFSYPIVDASTPIPNQSVQAVLFTNNHGYDRIYDAYRGNQHEDYLAYKFTDGVSSSERTQIMKNVESIAQANMAWGKNVEHIVSAHNDTSETVILAPQRIAFLEKLKGAISTISYATTTLLVLFSGLVVSLVIKKTINTNKKNYAILRANGYSKMQIAFSNTSIALIIGLASTIGGYISGHFLQYAFIRMFDNYWTLPVVAHSFSWLALVITVGIPFIGLALLAFVVTLWEMRGSIPNILAGGGSKTARGAVGKIIAPMRFVGIKSKTSLSLFLTNISKMVLIFLSSAAAIIALSSSISTIDKFNYAKAQSLSAKTYEYDLELATPTVEGGLMKALPVESLYTDVTNEQETFLNGVEDKQNDHFTKPTFHVPVSNDSSWKSGIKYLENKIQFKAMLDIYMGMSKDMGQNSWTIASNLMPDNQVNQSNLQDSKFLEFTANLDKTYFTGPNEKKNKDVWSDFLQRDAEGKYTVKLFNEFGTPNKNITINMGMAISINYRKFIYNGMRAAIEEYLSTPERNMEHVPFFISYKNLILDSDDELYSYIDGKFKLPSIDGKNEEERIKIKGLVENSQNIKLSSQAIENLKKFQAKPDLIPIVANEYFLTKYRKSIGDTFNVEVGNANDRYADGVKGLRTRVVKAQIVDSQETYNDNQLFTLKEYANKALGWKGDDAQKAFNGVYTKHKNSIIFRSVSLYSQSGLYPGTDTLSADEVNNPISKNVATYLKTPAAKAVYPSVANFQDFISNQVYSPSQYVMMYSNVNWSYTDEYRFDNVMNISSQIIYIIEGIVISLAVLFVVIISIMMINDNRKFIATLKVMGYREAEISRMVFAAFVPSLILALIAAIPLAIAVVLVLKISIMGFGAILVPLSITWWAIIASFAIITIGIGIVYWLSSRQLKNTSLLHAFQE